MIRIVPRNGMSVIDPATRRPMPVEGIEVEELNSYWLRRRNDGDIVELSDRMPANEPKPTKKARG